MVRHLFRSLALVAEVVGTFAAGSSSLEALFGPYLSPGTEFAQASDANFSEVVSPRWSEWEVPQWSGAIKPKTERDIQTIVRIASAHNISFMATNGGHGTSLIYGAFKGIDINLEGFNKVKVDVAKNHLIVGPGAKYGNITVPLYNAGKAVPRGNSPCVGVIGATIGGAIGFETGLYGLGIDALVSVRLVTASGALITVSDWQFPDLFWAIKGAGANFGIITEATFKMYDQPNNGNAVVGTFTYAASNALGVFEELQALDDILPAELGVQTGFSYNRTTNSTIVTVELKHFADWATFQPHLATAKRLGPLTIDVQNVTLVELFANLDGPCQSGAYISGGSAGLGRTDPQTYQAVLEEMTTFYEDYPGFFGETLFQRYANNNTLKTPLSSAVYPWRSTKTFWLHENIYTDPALEQPTEQLLLSLRQKLYATSGFDTPHIYLNYAYGDEGNAAWWSAENLPRLQSLKREWDPKNLFGHGTPITL